MHVVRGLQSSRINKQSKQLLVMHIYFDHMFIGPAINQNIRLTTITFYVVYMYSGFSRFAHLSEVSYYPDHISNSRLLFTVVDLAADYVLDAMWLITLIFLYLSVCVRMCFCCVKISQTQFESHAFWTPLHTH